MNAPIVADVRGDMALDCTFDMGVEELYAVKWYKDDQEFFRYMPRQKPQTMLYPVAGVHLASQETSCNKSYCIVNLQQLTKDHSSGAYRCEISSEAPAFRLASETHNVTVAALPRKNPRIEGLTKSYEEGDTMEARCISDFADPAPILSWRINGQPIPLKGVGEEPLNSEHDDNGLESRSIKLNLRAERKLSRGGSIEIRCESALPGVPLPPQVTTHNITFKPTPDPQVVNNQWLHLYGINLARRQIQPSEIASILFSIVMVRWSIEKLFK